MLVIALDIKPENILVTGATHSPDGTMVKPTEARIADFGLAIRSSAISVGKIAGTTGYFSPEACKSATKSVNGWPFSYDFFYTASLVFGRVQSHKSDMWAAGVSLFEIAVGKHPFGTFQDDAAGMIDAFARLLGKDGVPAEYHSALSVRPEQAIPLKDFLAKSIVNSRMVDMPLKKRLELADLLEKILVADPEQRISADVAVQHPFFRVRA